MITAQSVERLRPLAKKGGKLAGLLDLADEVRDVRRLPGELEREVREAFAAVEVARGELRRHFERTLTDTSAAGSGEEKKLRGEVIAAEERHAMLASPERMRAARTAESLAKDRMMRFAVQEFAGIAQELAAVSHGAHEAFVAAVAALHERESLMSACYAVWGDLATWSSEISRDELPSLPSMTTANRELANVVRLTPVPVPESLLQPGGMAA